MQAGRPSYCAAFRITYHMKAFAEQVMVINGAIRSILGICCKLVLFIFSVTDTSICPHKNLDTNLIASLREQDRQSRCRSSRATPTCVKALSIKFPLFWAQKIKNPLINPDWARSKDHAEAAVCCESTAHCSARLNHWCNQSILHDN